MLESKYTDHFVGRLVGVTKSDTKLSAAEKTVQFMRTAGFSTRDIRKAERMIARAKERGAK